MSRRKNETNVQFVKRIMEFSRHGALAQLFILDAIGKQADRVVNTGREEVIKQMENSFIHGASWFDVAAEIKNALANRG